MNTTLSRLLLVAVSVAAFVGLTTSASAAVWPANQHVKIMAEYGSSVFVNDHDTISETHLKANISGQVFGKLSPSSLSFVKPVYYCAGDEVRVALVVKAQTWVGDNTLKVTAQLVLYEGASCETEDLDGVGAPVTFTMKPGQSVGKYLQVWNNDEGGDFAEAWINFGAVVGSGV